MSSSQRKDQPRIAGFGAPQFVSPVKKRAPKRKQQTRDTFVPDAKRAAIQAKMDALEREMAQKRRALQRMREKPEESDVHNTMDPETPAPDDDPIPDVAMEEADNHIDMQTPTKPKRLVPDDTAIKHFNQWKTLLPALVAPYLRYLDRTMQKQWVAPPTELSAQCERPDRACTWSTHRLTGLIFGSPQTYSVRACSCESLTTILVSNGLFPVSPVNPRRAISVDLLDLLLSIQERSSDAVRSLAAALSASYRNRNFTLKDETTGKNIKQPFRKGLGYALRWYDCLRVEVERRTEEAIASKIPSPSDALPTTTTETHEEKIPSPSAASPTTTTETPEEKIPSPSAASPTTTTETPPLNEEAPPLKKETLPLKEAARILQIRCPACFGGKKYGRSLAKGGDCVVAIDANFNHRHARNAGNSPDFYTPEFVVPKEEVDAVGARIDAARPRKAPRPCPVPDSAIDDCQDAHQAGTGSTVKTSLEKFDSGGLAALVCRHDIPLFIANVDTPGEQQKYGVALVERLMSLLPPNATVAVLYDVGCVLDRSVSKYQIFDDQLGERLVFATSVMHSYVHQWACQLHYNPRMKPGMGLSDGENVERLWSALRGLIGVCRHSAANRRIWLIDRQLKIIALDHREDLGAWIRRKNAKGVIEQGRAAQRVIDENKIAKDVIETQWELQKTEQLSLRAHAPNILKKELGQLLNIQGDFEDLERTVKHATKLIQNGTIPKSNLQHLNGMLEQLGRIRAEADSMYSSLNVNTQFPSLSGVDLEFVRRLFLLRHLKATVQKKATSTLWEFDKLDQASGGKDMALGTKMHQHVRGAMTKKTAGLTAAVTRYNTECRALIAMRAANCRIPVPQPLPVKLSELKTCTSLMESVWVDNVDESQHRWIREPAIRESIRAMHKVQRCVEERERLWMEGDNMLRWFRREVTAIVGALNDPENALLRPILRRTFESIAAYANEWGTTFVASDRYLQALGSLSTSTTSLTWITVKPSSYQGQEEEDCDDREDEDFGDLDLDAEPLAADDVCLEDYLADRHDEEMEGDQDTGEALEEDAQMLPPVDEEGAREEGRQYLEVEPSTTNEAPEDDSEHAMGEDIPSELVEQVEGDETQGGEPWQYELNPRAVETPHMAENLFEDLEVPYTAPHAPHASRRLRAPSSRQWLAFFGPDEYHRVSGATTWLNDCCINGLMALIHQKLSQTSGHKADAERCAIFSSYNLLLNSSPDRLWPHVKYTNFWERDIWLVPIHRADSQHWVLAILLPLRSHILLFDSFASLSPWKHDLGRLTVFAKHLSAIAREQGINLPLGSKWTAQPLLDSRVQTNTVDCGVWILACAAAIMSGCHLPKIEENALPRFRSLLFQLLLRVPLSESQV